MSALFSLSANRHQLSRWWLPVTVFLLLTAATLAAWQWQIRAQREVAELTNSQESAAITSEIRERLRLHAQFLRSLQAFATANPVQDLHTWRRYAKQIDFRDSLSALFAFAYAPAVTPEATERFLFATRQPVDRGNFKIFPPPRGQIVAPILFIAPETPELQAAVGFDMLSETVRHQAIRTATTTRDVAMSGPIVLVTDKASRRSAFLMVHALYQTGLPLESADQRQFAFGGVVLTAYRTDVFFSSLKQGDQSGLALQVFDESLSGDKTRTTLPTLIYDSDPDLQIGPDTPTLHHEIDFGGRNWILEFRPRSNYGNTQILDLPSVILVGGMLGNMLLSLLIFHLGTHRERAVQYAQRLTQELRTHRDHLHELVAERTVRLETALQRGLAANEAKSKFLANMSHELRTPMHAVLSFSQLGIERSEADGQTKASQYFQRIEQSATRLLDLINELLDLSKLESGRFELELAPIDINAVLHHTIAQIESLLIAHDLKIELVSRTADSNIIADPKRLTQVFFNLLSNAIKFSPAHGLIRIEFDAATLPLGRRADDNGTQPALAIRFIDSGIGIPPMELESIFDKFEQSSATRNGAGGTGLGLAISRAVVLQHRGTIIAENNIGGGACFTVTLPKNHGTEINAI